MTVWRPHQVIEVKALGLVWRDRRLLASDVCNDDGSVKGVRPLGGRPKFGESWRDALAREFQEEVGSTVRVARPPMVMENIYSHHGSSATRWRSWRRWRFPKMRTSATADHVS